MKEEEQFDGYEVHVIKDDSTEGGAIILEDKKTLQVETCTFDIHSPNFKERLEEACEKLISKMKWERGDALKCLLKD